MTDSDGGRHEREIGNGVGAGIATIRKELADGARGPVLTTCSYMMKRSQFSKQPH